MYTLNVAQRAQPLPPRSHKSSVSGDSANSPDLNVEAGQATAQFSSTLMAQLSQLPAQPCSLPPSFIVSFVRRCFHPQLTMVDFPQGLTALDYLKDLEMRRRREVHDAFKRLDIHPDTADTDMEEAISRYPSVTEWVKNILEKTRKVEELYTHIYVGLRRWILINEMSLSPFNKHNCAAMLNTLYPPMPPSTSFTPPTPRLTKEVLEEHRRIFFNWIRRVEKRGPKELKTLLELGRREGEASGWNAVQDALDKYLLTAKNIIDDCVEMNPVYFPSLTPEEEALKRKGRKVDSGVSFGSEKRPSTSTSSSSINVDKPLPSYPPSARSNKGASTLEKISREFKKMRLKPRASHVDLRQEAAPNESPILQAQQPDAKPRNTLKKMRSMGALADMKQSSGSINSLHGHRVPSETPDFDPEVMKKHRMLYEASQAKLRSHES